MLLGRVDKSTGSLGNSGTVVPGRGCSFCHLSSNVLVILGGNTGFCMWLATEKEMGSSLGVRGVTSA